MLSAISSGQHPGLTFASGHFSTDTSDSDLAHERLVLYTRNPRKNDAAVDRMCSSIREFGFKKPATLIGA